MNLFISITNFRPPSWRQKESPHSMRLCNQGQHYERQNSPIQDHAPKTFWTRVHEQKANRLSLGSRTTEQANLSTFNAPHIKRYHILQNPSLKAEYTAIKSNRGVRSKSPRSMHKRARLLENLENELSSVPTTCTVSSVRTLTGISTTSQWLDDRLMLACRRE
ncbi:hypothetical protein BD289DRAFT_31576 [Coniella lustricola]|uniref:Uncharacterized protein n=1 Tax=Coniella lustricola TaxID=2025994 RepID=A0A2T3A2T3_9PEZI|nr:hypothetical protein BD289DRAFT_31576 [Coniella lustricola]